MNTAKDIKRMLGELVDEAIRIGRAEGEKTLGTDAQLKEQVKRLTDDKRKLTQSLDHVNEENNDLELTIGQMKDALNRTGIEIGTLRGQLDGYDAVNAAQAKKIRELEEQVHQLDAENGLLDKTVENLRKKLEDAEAKIKEPTPAACPFCGGRPDVVAINKERWVVACHCDTCAVNPETDTFDTIEEAVSAWNHRAGDLTCDWR